MSIPIIIDCDPGHDDAIALLLALASPEVNLLGVTTVAGNSTLDKTTVNALKVLELSDHQEVPVAVGAGRPLVRELVVAEHVHGKSGLDGPDLPDPVTLPVAVHAVDFLAERILSSPEPVTLIPVGPLTNIALLLSRYPEAFANVSRIVSMGGAIGTGNVTPAAEFNIYVDPEAAHRVYHSGVPITMIGLDITHQALLDQSHAERLRSMGRAGRFVAELLDFFIGNYPRHRTGGGGAPIHDAVAVACVIWPDLVSAVDCHVTVDTQSELCRGRTVVDRWHVTGKPTNAAVGLALSGDRFAEILIERISRLG
jgi:pyrimidine-specific ribonucleoside hydrolase